MEEPSRIDGHINPSRGFFRKWELVFDYELNYLVKSYDYVKLSAVGLKDKRQDTYLLKPRHNESPIHFFLCKVIEEFLREEITKRVWLYTTARPDVVFQVGKRRIAVEVETGSGAEHPKRMWAKVRRLNREFREDWFFVVTNSKLKKVYGRWGRAYLRGEVVDALRVLLEKEREA